MAALSHFSSLRTPTNGDRLSALARWLVVALVCWSAVAIYRVPLRIPSDSIFGNLVLAYMAYAVIASVVPLVRSLERLCASIFVVDMLLLIALGWTTPGQPLSYAMLLLCPLVVLVFRQSRPVVLGLSSVAAALLLVMCSSDLDPLLIVGQTALLGGVPYLVSLLSERWLQTNRADVQAAEQRARTAAQQAGLAQQQVKALYDVAAVLNATGDPQQVFHTILTACAQFMPYRAAAIVLPTGTTDEVYVVASAGLSGAEAQQRFAVAQGTLGQILRGASGGVLQHAQHETELAPLPAIQHSPSIALLPLRSQRRTFGVALFGCDSPVVTAEQMEAATTLVTYGLTSLQNANLIAELRAERDHLLVKEEEVRKQLNRDLHDGPAQALAAITMTVGLIKHMLKAEPERVVPELDKLQAVAKRANHDVRTLLFELRPLVLETQGLMPTLRQYLERFEKTDLPTKVIVEGDDALGPISERAQGALFNIITESTNNALKHAQAKTIWIRLTQTTQELIVTIQDDGRGFNVAAVKASYDQRCSFGLLSLEERAKLVGGSADLVTAPGAGTTVRVTIPLDL